MPLLLPAGGLRGGELTCPRVCSPSALGRACSDTSLLISSHFVFLEGASSCCMKITCWWWGKKQAEKAAFLISFQWLERGLRESETISPAWLALVSCPSIYLEEERADRKGSLQNSVLLNKTAHGEKQSLLRGRAQSTHSHHTCAPSNRSSNHQRRTREERPCCKCDCAFGSGCGGAGMDPRENSPNRNPQRGGCLTCSTILSSRMWALQRHLLLRIPGLFHSPSHYNLCPLSKDSVLAWEAELAGIAGPGAQEHAALAGVLCVQAQVCCGPV